MKLYFYHLSQPLGEKPRIVVCEYDAKSERMANNLFKSFSMMFSNDGVVLREKNFAKVAEIFKERLHAEIKQKQDKIDELKKELAKAYDLIDMVDDWRLENETH